MDNFRGTLEGSASGFGSWILKHKFKVLLLFFVVLIVINFFEEARAAFFVGFLIVLGSVSTIYKYRIKISFGFELVTLATVLSTVVYGPIIGFFVGFISALAAEILPQMIEASSFFWILSTASSAFIVAFMYASGTTSLVTLGMVSLIFQLIISEPLRILGPIEVRLQGFIYIITAVIWNIFVFSTIAPIMLRLMVS